MKSRSLGMSNLAMALAALWRHLQDAKTGRHSIHLTLFIFSFKVNKARQSSEDMPDYLSTDIGKGVYLVSLAVHENKLTASRIVYVCPCRRIASDMARELAN